MKTRNLVFLSMLALFAGGDLWAIPAGFNIQGRLTDANGTNQNDTFSIKFAVFATITGGSPVWEQTQSVLVQNGNFQVVLKGVDLENAVKNLEDAYVEIKVGSENPLVPRQQLLRSPFSSASVVSGKVDVLIQSDNQAAGSGLIAFRTGNTDRITILNNGNIGIGVANPANALEVAGTAAFGLVDIGLEIVHTVCGNTATCTLRCPAGKRVLGGGCQLQHVASNLWRSFPMDPYTWYCGYTDGIGTDIYVDAICARVK